MQESEGLIPFEAQGKPEKGLLRDWLEFSLPLSPAPLQYHLFVGLVVMAAALGDRVFIPFGAQRVCTHLWVTLVGPSPLDRASAIGIARRVLGRLEESPLISEPATIKRARRALSVMGNGLLIWPDLGDALKSLKWRSCSGFRGFLADIFDARTDYALEEGVLKAKAPALSILAGSSIEGLSQETGRLLPRFLLVPAPAKDEGQNLPSEPDEELEEQLGNSLKELTQLCGPADFSQVKLDYALWRREHEEENKGPSQPFLAFMPLYLLKLSLLYQLSLGTDLKVCGEAVAWAATILSWLKERLVELPLGEAGKKGRILRLIESHPGISHARALRNSNMKATEFRQCLDALREEGRIELRNGYYYPGSP